MSSQSGVALIMVLWVLMFLTVIAMSLSVTTRTGALSAGAYADKVKKSFIAEGGVEYAVLKLFERKQFSTTAAPGIWRVDGTPYEVKTAGGAFVVSITDETGKVDINHAPPILLMGLLDALGVDFQEQAIITDSIQDWRDKDSFVRLNGAEDSYYLSLPMPYSPKNADFVSTAELIYVRGITADLLYGKEGGKGLMDFVTIYSGTERISVNAAPVEVLAALPGMTRETAQTIVDFRDHTNIANSFQLQGLAGSSLSGFFNMAEGRTYSILSVGQIEKNGHLDPNGHAVGAIVEIGNTYSFKYVKWESRAKVK